VAPVFRRLIVGISGRMDKLVRVRHAEKRIVRLQRRVWLAQILMWPTIILGAILSVGAVVWFVRRRSGGGRHEMPDTPGAHEAGLTDGQTQDSPTPI
jgi:hypothetical protein